MPKQTLEHQIEHLRRVNYEGSYYMRTVQQQNKKLVAGKVAEIVGCTAEEVALTRNTTESLDLIIGGRIKVDNFVIIPGMIGNRHHSIHDAETALDKLEVIQHCAIVLFGHDCLIALLPVQAADDQIEGFCGIPRLNHLIAVAAPRSQLTKVKIEGQCVDWVQVIGAAVEE